ncbi:MAG TPA: methyltransferase [Propionibacteriaceae bacterium]|nr:methyltransferase [Propionibacteriaceae bacterium]
MMMDTSEFDPAEYLRRLFDDVEFSYLVVVAAELGVADLLASGPRSIADLSTATGADAQALYRVLRALGSRGLFREEGGKRFSLTPLADPLRQDAPQSIRPQALWSGSEAYRRTWGDLSYSVRTGEPAFDHVYGKPFFDYLAEQPAVAKIFNDVMTSASSDEGAAIAAAHDFSGYRRIVDVGGGHGALLAAVLDRYQVPLGVLFDLPEVVETTHGAIDRHIATGRVEKVAGDFSEAVPPGGDAYLLKWIVHDWDDEAAIKILANCRTAMVPTGKVLLVETVIPEGTVGSDATRVDTAMLVFTGSRERSEGEYRDLLQRAGLTLVKTTPTASQVSILEATPDGQH